MEAKTIEIRDRMTMIPALAVRLDPGCEADRLLLARSGYGVLPVDQAAYILFGKLGGGDNPMRCDPYAWGDRTMATAHHAVVERFGELESGDVLDVEFILGETDVPKGPDLP